MQNMQPDSPLESEDLDPQILPTTTPEVLQQIIVRIQGEIRTLQVEHKAILKRIEVIKRTTVGLAHLFGAEFIDGELGGLLDVRNVEQSHRSPGLTAACRRLLQKCAEPLTARQMLESLRGQEPNLVAHHKYPDAALRVVLARLVSYGEAEEVVRLDNLRVWKKAGKAVSITAPVDNLRSR
jgi:hypothetical protein